MTGLQQLAWLLRRLKKRHPDLRATTDWEAFKRSDTQVFVWEAFVSGAEKGPSHHADALLALKAFEDAVRLGEPETCVKGENPISLAGALILWVGLGDDIEILRRPTLVLRPRHSS